MRKPNPYRRELKLARSQRKRLQTIVDKLTDLSIEWDGLHGGLEVDFNLLADAVSPQLTVLDDQIAEWAEGLGDPREDE